MWGGAWCRALSELGGGQCGGTPRISLKGAERGAKVEERWARDGCKHEGERDHARETL